MKNNKLKKLKNLKLRTKILAWAVISFLLLTGISIVPASDPVYKSGTDDSGDSWDGPIGAITNSNGRVWDATTADLQKAIDNSSGETIFVGADITITSAINMVNNTLLDFQWHNITLTGSAGFHMIQIGDGVSPVTDVEIMHGNFYGNRSNQAGLFHCIYTQDKCQRIKIHDNYFTGWYGKAVSIEGGAGADNCYYISVYNNIMDDFEQGIDADGIDFDQVTWGTIENNQIKEAGDDGIDVGAGGSINIIGNVIRDCVNGIELYATKATVVGNTCDKSDYYGIVLDSCKVTTVSGNYIYFAGRHGIRLLYAVSCSITGNTFWRCSSSSDNTYDSIHLESKGADPCVNNTIIGNTILADGTNKVKYGINESDSYQDYNVIFGNTIDGPVTGMINKSGVHSIIGYNVGYETVFPTSNVSTAQVGYAYLSGSGLLVKGSDGWFNLTTSGATLTEEEVEDYVGGMFTGNTETRCTVTYQDGDGTIDVVVDDLDTDTTYSSGTGINLTATTFSFNGTWGNAQYLNHALFGSNGLIKRTGASTYGIVTDNSANWDTAYGWGDHSGEGYITATLTDEQVQDKIGAMVTGNTETGITVTYQDGDGTLDFVVSGGGGGSYNTSLIWNSNNKSWSPTRANVQAAIDDLESSPGFGSVWVGSAISMDGTPIYPKSDVLVDFGFNEITFASDGEFINVTDGCRRATVVNARVDPYAGTTEGIITFYADTTGGQNSLRFNTIKNIKIEGGSSDKLFTGIELIVNCEQSIANNRFQDIWTYWADTGIKLSCSGSAAGWINGNIFDNCYIDYFETMVEIDQVLGDIDYNEFRGVKGQTVDSDSYSYLSDYGIIVEGTGNVFENCLVWDFPSSNDAVYQYWIKDNAFDTVVDDYGISDGYYLDEGHRSVVKEKGGNLAGDSIYNFIIGSIEETASGKDKYFVKNGETGQVYKMYDTFPNAFEGALEQKGTGKANIFILEGEYWVNYTIANDYFYDVYIDGAGKDLTILKQGANLASGMFYLYSSLGYVDNIEFHNIGFDGKNTDLSLSDGEAIRIRNSNNVVIEDCAFYDHDDNHIYVSLSSTHCEGLRIRNNVFSECTPADAVIRLAGGASDYITHLEITGNTFLDATNDIVQNEVSGYVGNFSFTNNIIVDNTDSVILDSAGTIENVVVDNNAGYFVYYAQDTAPSLNDNCTAYWYDTDDDFMYQVTNAYGSTWYVNMTKTI